MALVAILSVALTIAVAVILVAHRQRLQAQRTLAGQASTLASVLGRASRPRAFAVIVANASRIGGGIVPLGPVRTARVLAAIPAGHASGEITVAGRSLLYAENRVAGGGEVVLIRSAALATGEVVPLTLSLIVAALGGALLAALLSLLVARRVTRPVAALASAAARLPGEPDVRVEERGPAELVSLAAHFNEMARALEVARAGQRTFLLSVSHELKTPLTAIRGYAEGLADGAVGSGEAAEVIGAETKRLERLVGDLLDLARAERAEFWVQRERVDLGALAEGTRERFAAAARERGVRIEVAVEPGASALADPDRLVQVISNLLENALRVTPPGGSITLAGAAGVLTVTDTGPGIDPADLPHAFERFHLHRRGGEGGSGLGLAIVAELVRAMGGEASVTSIPGQGARFEVRLPGEPAAG